MCESVTWLWLYDVQDSQAVHAYVCKTLNFPVQHEVAQTEDRPCTWVSLTMKPPEVYLQRLYHSLERFACV